MIVVVAEISPRNPTLLEPYSSIHGKLNFLDSPLNSNEVAASPKIFFHVKSTAGDVEIRKKPRITYCGAPHAVPPFAPYVTPETVSYSMVIDRSPSYKGPSLLSNPKTHVAGVKL
jgi:hypothetical protein